MTKTTTEWPALQDEKRTHVCTENAAWHLNVKPATMRAWASSTDGPIQPTRLGRRLLWPTDKIRGLLGVEAGQ